MTPRTRISAQPWGVELPFVGRRNELAALQAHLTAAAAGRGSCVLLTGDAGVGKSRLLAALVQQAQTHDMLIAAGTAFAAEAAVPYGALADALARPLRALEPTTLTVLARGAEGDLRAIVPGLAGTSTATGVDSGAESGGKARLLWNVTQFLTRLAARTPLLLVLDNAHESDASSLEFIHFLARQVAGARILIVLAYLDDAGDEHRDIRTLERSLLTSHDATKQRVDSLTAADLAELLARSFDLNADVASHHGATLWSHTRGNPFFVDESLKALAAAGRIRQTASGWLMEDAIPATLPATVREGVLRRLDALTAGERRLTELLSIADSRAALSLLEQSSGLDIVALADGIDTLCSRRLIVEYRTGDTVEYEFSHPIIQATVRSTLTAPRERLLHASMATALETLHGTHALERAGEIARHLARSTDAGGDPRALRYLTAAGHDALARRANPEAARWLSEALAIAEVNGDDDTIAPLLDALATARLRLGESAAAVQLWYRALAVADRHHDHDARARLLLQLAQEAARDGDAVAGLARLDDAEAAAVVLARRDLVIRINIARAKMLQALGRHTEATRAIQTALNTADALGDVTLRARAHQTALQLYAWTGPAELAREHGAYAITLANQSGAQDVAWAAHWAMAMLEGFTGDVEGVARHVGQAGTLADALASPVLQAMTAEIEIEHASGVGRWDEALAIAERTIPLARAIMPHSLLPRLLVWTGLIVLERDESERASELFEEAWVLSGAARLMHCDVDSNIAIDNVHNMILAHTGMGMYALSLGNWVSAREYGDRGLALADRFGYVAWAIHRLIPMLIEAALRLEDFDRAEELTTRLRRQSTDLGHRLGLAWATAAEALVARVKLQAPDAAARLLAAADALDAVPYVFHGARARRNAAQVLAADGDAKGAERELRRAHEVFARLGAEFELRGVRSQLRSLGLRLPPRTSSTGSAALTGRELEIARAVARRLTNKQIGASLEISARTVSTHLSNIFEKLGVDSRGALADAVREDPQLRES